jgi:hypothetical protein
MSEEHLSTLLEVYNRLEAEIIKEALEVDGIPAGIFQRAAGALYGFSFGPEGKIEIRVPTERLEEAKTWLKAYNRGELRNDNAELSDPDPE